MINGVSVDVENYYRIMVRDGLFEGADGRLVAVLPEAGRSQAVRKP
jgi:hypothetical protein